MCLFLTQLSFRPEKGRPNRAQQKSLDERSEIERLAKQQSPPVPITLRDKVHSDSSPTLIAIVVLQHTLSLMSEDRPHNGVVLDCEPLRPEVLNALPSPSTNSEVWVALDEINDPQNLGAVLRSCLYFGVTGVVICSKNSAPLSPTTSKASR